MKVTVEPNTNPINPAAIAAKNFSFSSGGGGGSGGGTTTIFPQNINVDGDQNALIVPVPLATEVDLVTFNIAMLGGKKALLLAFSAITNLVGLAPQYKIRLYVNGVIVCEVLGTTAQTFNWGYLIPLTLAGVNPVKLSVENTGGATFDAGISSCMVMEFQS